MVLIEFSLSQKHLKYRQYIAGFSAIIFLLFIGLRWETGTDWLPYKNLFDTLELNWSFLLAVYHFDFGYVLLNAFVKLFTDNYTIFLLIDAAIAIIPLYFLIKKLSPYPNLSLLLFYVNYMIAQFMGSNRRMIAMVFILWFMYYVASEIKRKTIFPIIGAFFFHRSSIINILLYFFPRKPISITKTIVILLSSFVIGILQIPAIVIDNISTLILPYSDMSIVRSIEFYSNNDVSTYSTGDIVSSTILAVGKRIIFLTLYLYISKKKHLDSLTVFFLNVYTISVAMYLLLIGSFFQMVTAYWTIVEIVLIGRIFLYTSKAIKMYFWCFLCLFSIIQIISSWNIYVELYVPYLPFWTTIHRF